MARERLARGRQRKSRYASPQTGSATKMADSANQRAPGAFAANHTSTMRDDYLAAALKVIDDPNILVNVISRRVKQLKRGNRALVESLEKLSAEDTALREVIEGKISFELATPEELARAPASLGRY